MLCVAVVSVVMLDVTSRDKSFKLITQQLQYHV